MLRHEHGHVGMATFPHSWFGNASLVMVGLKGNLFTGLFVGL